MSSVTQPGPRGVDRPPTASAPIFWGVVLIAAGVVFLAQSLGLLPSPSGSAVGVTFVVAGLVLLASFVVLHTHWWTLIAGPVLLATGAVILLPGGGSGSIFLGGIGLGFALVALTSAKRWWAIIPAGTMFTLALVALLADTIGGLMSGAVLFIGLAVTFGVLSLIKVDGKRMSWPLYPALGLLLFGVALAMGSSFNNVIWPLALIAAGLFVLIQATMKRT